MKLANGNGHFGQGEKPQIELVTSFQGEGDIASHTRHAPEVAMGDLWTDIRDQITSGLQEGVASAGAGVLQVASQQPQVQATAKESAVKYFIENYWKEALIGAAATAGLLAFALGRKTKRRR